MELREVSVLIILMITAQMGMAPTEHALPQNHAQSFPIKRLQCGQMQAIIACLVMGQANLCVRVTVLNMGTIMTIMHR